MSDAHDGSPQYPRQDLLPQQVKPGRSRLPLVVGAAAVVLLLVGGLVTWRLLSGGDHSRAAYCAALRRFTHNGDVMSAFVGAGPGVQQQVSHIVTVAPSSVAASWNSLEGMAQSVAAAGSLDPAKVLEAYSALKTISSDAQTNCGLTLNLPGGL